MALNAKHVPSAGGNYDRPEPVEPGTYPCRLVQVMVLGIQPQRPFKGEEKAPALEISLTYEMLDEFMKDENGDDIEDKPRWILETMPFHNLDADRARSTKRYYALDPDDKHDGDWGALLGTPCMVTVTVTEGSGKNAGKFYENVSNVSSMRPKEAAKAPELVNEPRVFDFYEPDMEAWGKLPKWLKEKMQNAVDFGGSKLEKALEDYEEEDESEEKPKTKEAKKPAKKETPEPKKPKVKDEDLDDEIPW